MSKKTAKAKVAEAPKIDPDKPIPYRLEGAGRYQGQTQAVRVEMISPMMARARNSVRELHNYSGRWVPETDPNAEVTYPAKIISGKEREKAYSNSRRKDAEWLANLQKAKAAANQTTPDDDSKPLKVRTTDRAVPKAPGKSWEGFNMCQILRFCGARGWDTPSSKAVANGVGFEPSDATIKIQGKKGAAGDNVPTLTAEQTKKLESFLPAPASPVRKKFKKGK